MKKFLSLVLALVMTMSLVTISAGAKDFTDASKINYKEAIDVMSTIKVVDGYTDGSFNPGNTLTRGAAAKIICNLLLGPTTASALVADTAPYSDVPANSTFAGYIAYCQKQGIISGYADGTFKPGNTLTGYAFMKMLLGALGYEAEFEGYTGANWSINVAKQALAIGLDNGLISDFNGIKPVTREEACLYAFNMLQADLVEYEKGNTIVVNGTTISSGVTVAKAVTSTNSSAANKNIGPGTNKDNYIQFAEQYFNKLVETNNQGDAFGRPATTWHYKGVKIGTYADKADKTYVGDFKLNAIYNDLGMSTAAAKTILNVNGIQYNITATNNVKRTNDTKLSKVNAASASVGNGTIVEVFLDGDTNEVTICTMSVYAGKISDVKEATAKRDAYVVVEAGTKNVAGLNATNNTFETEEFEEDDIVAFTFSNKTGEIKSMYKMESVEGTLTKRVVTKSIQLGDDVISYGKAYDFEDIDETDLANKSSYVVYKDANGYALWVTESKFGVDAYAYVEKITNEADGLEGDRVRLVTADGTKLTVDLDKDYVDEFGIADGDLVRYSKNSDNTYKLVQVDPAGDNFDVINTIDESKVVDTDNGSECDSDTIFVINKSGETSWKVYKGIKNVPVIEGVTTSVAYVRDGVVKIAFLDGADVVNTSKDVTFVATKSVTKLNKSTNDGVDYYVYNAVVKGEITTICVEDIAVLNTDPDTAYDDTLTSGNELTAGAKRGLIFNSSTYSSVDDEVISDANFQSSIVSVFSATGVKKAGEKTIKLNNSLKDVASNCAIFEVSFDGSTIEKISLSEVKTNSAAEALYTVEDGEITNLFILLPQD